MPKQKSTAEKPARKIAAKTPAAKTAAKSTRSAAPRAEAEPRTGRDQPTGGLDGSRAESTASLDAPDAQASLDQEELQRLIREAAYFKAKARNFAPGHEVQDWVEAESEVRLRFESGDRRQGRSV
jgi:hypothetical protein